MLPSAGRIDPARCWQPLTPASPDGMHRGSMAGMETTLDWFGPIEPAAKPRLQFWFTLARLFVVVSLIAGAAALVTIAFAQHYLTARSTSPHLECPPVVATQPDLVTPQAEQSTVAGAMVADKTMPPRQLHAKAEEHTSLAKSQLSNTVRTGVSPKRTATAGLTKRSVIASDQKTSKPSASAPTLSQSGYLSPFTDRHGQ